MKRVLKVVLCIVFSLVLVCPALAETTAIRVQMGAPERLEMSFASSSNRLTFVIDADVEVPDVSNVSVYEVLPTIIPAENIVALADHLIGAGNWMGAEEYMPDTYENVVDGITSESMAIIEMETSMMMDAIAEYHNGVLRGQIRLNYDDITGIDDLPSMPFSSEDLDASLPAYGQRGTEAAGCAYSYMDAEGMARTSAEIIAPELTEVVGRVAVGRDGETEGYMFCFYRKVDGIPVTYTIFDGIADIFHNDGLTYKEPWPYEQLKMIVYGDRGLTTVRYQSPYQIGERLEDHVELLPFDQIMEIAQKLLPLSLAAFERDIPGENVRVDRIVFGYARVDMKNEPYRYKLIPVWDFIGGIDGQDTGYFFFKEDCSLLTIDAVTGMTIDRNFGY